MFNFFRPAYTLMWYVLREFLVTFALTLMAMTVFMLLLIVYTMAAELDNFGVGPSQVVLLSPFFLPRALTLALPPATMIAAIMVFGRLSAENEILAAQAGGAALRRYVGPLLFCSVLISLSSLWLHDEGLRWGNDTIRTRVLGLNKPEFFKNVDKPGSSFSIRPDPNKYTRINLLAADTGKDGRETLPIQIISFVNSKIVETIFARGHQFFVDASNVKSGADRKLSIMLKDAQIFGENYNSASEIVSDISLPDIGALIPIGTARGQKSWRENMDDARKITRDEHRRWKFMLRDASQFGALAAGGSVLDAAAPGAVANSWNNTKLHTEYIVGQGGAVDRGKQDSIEFHRKIALSTLPISMIFLGIGLGLLVKKSNRMIGFLLGLALYFLLYYPLTIVAKSLSSSGNWDKFSKVCPPQYLPNILFLIFGYGLWRMYEHGFHLGLSRLFRSDSEVAEESENLDSTENLARVIEKRQKNELTDVRVVGPISLLAALGKLVYWAAWAGPRSIFGFIARIPVSIFRRTTDKYIGTMFLAPLIVVAICFAGLLTTFDVIEHMTEIVDGIRHSNEPLGALPIRTQAEALRDVVVYYGIQSLDCTLEYWHFEVLVAGLLCAMVLVRNQEHLILKSSGIKLQRALRPVIIFALLAGGCVMLIREMWMPELIVHRDFLKPQVYHRNSQPSSLALYAVDESAVKSDDPSIVPVPKKKPLLFEMGSYSFATKQGREMRVFLLHDPNVRSILVADVAKWNTGWEWNANHTLQEFHPEHEGWKLYTDPAVQAMKQLEQGNGPFGGSKDKGKDKDKDSKKKSKTPTVETATSTATTAEVKLPKSTTPFTLEVVNTTWMSVGDIVYLAGGGLYRVTGISSGNEVTLENYGPPEKGEGSLIHKGSTIEKPTRTITMAEFTQPVPGTAFTLAVDYSEWMTTDQIVWISGSGYYKVVATPTRNSVTLTNVDSLDNARLGERIPAGRVLEKPKEYPGGQRRETDNETLRAASGQNPATLPAASMRITQVNFWQGPINPKYIDNDRLGAKVMRLSELEELSKLKPELKVDRFKRLSEFAMGFLLLWCALPLMLSDSAGSAVTSIAVSTLLAALYMGLNVACYKLALENALITIPYIPSAVFRVPHWAPLIPHGIFFVIGYIQFYWRMET